MDTPGTDLSRADRCRHCHASLSYDQRYCTECGTRRGAQPAAIERIVARIREGGEPLPADGAAAVKLTKPARPRRPGGATPPPVIFAPRHGGRRRSPETWTPSPIAAALAVMGMLGFGVIVGDISGAQSLVRSAFNSGTVTVNLPATAAAVPVTNAVPTTTVASAPAATSSPSAPAPQTVAATTPAAVSTTPSGSGEPPLPALPPVKHVFVIVLSDEGYAQTFSPASKDTYLNKTLPAQGELVDNYYAVAGSSLSNGVALLTGQGPTQDNEADCPSYSAIRPFHLAKYTQVVGEGCVYPKTTESLPQQLTAHKDTYKAYLEGLNDGPTAQLASCGQPKAGTDQYHAPTEGDPYVAWRNPFAYIGALTPKGACRQTVAPLTALAGDLRKVSSTPSLAYIVPGACDDGESTPCRPGAAAGLGPADAFLKRTLTLIEASPAYKADGLIAITFDHAQQSGPHKDSSACCSTPVYPNVPAAGSSGTSTGTTTTTATPAPPVTPTNPYTIAPTPDTTSPGVTTVPPTAPGVVTTSPGTGSTTGTSTTSTCPITTGTTTGVTTPTTPPTTTPTTATTGTTGTTTSSCLPSSTAGGETTPTGGGGQVGLLLLSKYVKPGSSDVIDYFNHYALLDGIDALFKLGKLGYGDNVSMAQFPVNLYNAGS